MQIKPKRKGRRCEMKIKKLWIKIISIVAEFWINILLFHIPVRFKKYFFVNIYKIVMASILIVLGIITYFILKFLL
jgi:hypothetical protein